MESLSGTKEKIVEYDFTAGRDTEAALALKKLAKKRRETLEAAETAAPDAETPAK